MPFSFLEGLCVDIPVNSFYTPEIFPSNDYYGNAEQVKRFLDLPSYYPLKAVIQHGNQYGEHYWDLEISPELPVSLAWGSHIYETWKKHTDKHIEKIGAPFFYTQGLLSEEGVIRERRRLGKNLLVFPAHSMHHTTITFDMQSWLARIASFATDFDSIRICIYWKDYLLGLHTPYQEAGYECVSAGHIFDCNFLPRLRSLLEVSDASISNRLGSFIGYSVFLDRPHILIDQQMDVVDHNGIGKVTEEERMWRNDPGVQKIFQVFSQKNFIITEKHLSSLEPYFGFSCVKSKNELLDVFVLSEELYSKKEFFDKNEVQTSCILNNDAMLIRLKKCISKRIKKYL